MSDEEPHLEFEGPRDFISTEQRNKFTWEQQKLLDSISKMGIALVKIDHLEPEPEMTLGGFLVSYKVRLNDVMLVKIPKTGKIDESWAMLACHLEAESRRLP